MCLQRWLGANGQKLLVPPEARTTKCTTAQHPSTTYGLAQAGVQWFCDYKAMEQFDLGMDWQVRFAHVCGRPRPIESVNLTRVNVLLADFPDVDMPLVVWEQRARRRGPIIGHGPAALGGLLALEDVAADEAAEGGADDDVASIHSELEDPDEAPDAAEELPEWDQDARRFSQQPSLRPPRTAHSGNRGPFTMSYV